MLEKQKTNQFPAEARQDMPDKREFRGWEIKLKPLSFVEKFVHMTFFSKLCSILESSFVNPESIPFLSHEWIILVEKMELKWWENILKETFL